MELFLNLCWLSLLLPAWLLWRQRTFSTGSSGPGKGPTTHPLIFICVLGCALVLLFPVISASDDLHAMRPEMEESERAFRHTGHIASTSHVAYSARPVLLSFVSLTPEFGSMSTVLPFAPPMLATLSSLVPAARAPPSGDRTGDRTSL